MHNLIVFFEAFDQRKALARTDVVARIFPIVCDVKVWWWMLIGADFGPNLAVNKTDKVLDDVAFWANALKQRSQLPG
jgi:hypothetical protein